MQCRNAQAVWLRCLNSAAFGSLKKYAAHFFNFDFVETEPKEAPYETTGNNVELLAIISLKLNTGLHLTLLFIFISLTSIR